MAIQACGVDSWLLHGNLVFVLALNDLEIEKRSEENDRYRNEPIQSAGSFKQ